MSGEERRKQILAMIRSSSKPISGGTLSEKFKVSRQVIVQDIALLRAADVQIVATNRGYLCEEVQETSRVFKVYHNREEILDELYTIVDLGGKVADVFVDHKVYGCIRVDLQINSRKDARNLMDDIMSGQSGPLLDVTSGYHYHTVLADSTEDLELIQDALKERGYLL